MADLRSMVDRIPKESFPVRKVWTEIEHAWQDSFWTLITTARIDILRLKVGPLLRFAASVDVAAETFTHKVERLKLRIPAGCGTCSRSMRFRTSRRSYIFKQHIAAHRYNDDQIRFLLAVQELFLTQCTLAEADLYKPPLTVFGRNEVDRFFSPTEVRGTLT